MRSVRAVCVGVLWVALLVGAARAQPRRGELGPPSDELRDAQKEAYEELREIQKKDHEEWTAQIKDLREAQAETDQKLNILIDTVDRIIPSRDNGHKAEE